MTNHQRRVISLWIDRAFRALVVAGLCIALFAVVRDVQTRGLVDKTAREKTQALCVSVNDRWSAYFKVVSDIAEQRRPGETKAAFQVRKTQTIRLVRRIRSAVTVDCNKEIQ